MKATKKDIKAIGAAPTPEEKKEMAIRAFVQKRNAIAEMTIANTLHSMGADYSQEGARDVVDFALDLADYYMEKAMGLKAEPKSQE